MKKLISCLLAVMMLFAATSAFAVTFEEIQKNTVLNDFLNETDLKTKDLAMQVQSGEETNDVVIRLDGDNLHLVTREGSTVKSHMQLNPTGIYVAENDAVTMVRFDTLTTIAQNFFNEVTSFLEQAIQSAPEGNAPTEEEIKKAVTELSVLAKAIEAQEQADAVTLSSAAMAFAGKFKPENILDVKEENGSVQISLRSEAYASALADAMDELMLNANLGKLVDRYATDGTSFADIQKDWLENRQAILDAIRSAESTDKVEENGHWTSHFQIGEEDSAVKILVSDSDAWIDAENGYVEITSTLGFKNEEPILVYELAVNPSAYAERLTSRNSYTDVRIDFDSNRMSSGKVTTVIEGKEEMKAEFGPDYMYMKGPKGGVSTSVRETWTGKIRYELVSETADNQETAITIDFYRDDDAIIAELMTNESEATVQFKVSRIDKIELEDLTASDKINEITVDAINAELENILKTAIPAAATENSK